MLRLPGKDTGLLGIDREAERAANAMAATRGRRRRRWRRSWPTRGCLVTRFVAGEPVESEELREPVLLAEVAGRLHAVHSGPRTALDASTPSASSRPTATPPPRTAPRIPAAYDDALALAPPRWSPR